jgi:enoyl-CoA hydratase
MMNPAMLKIEDREAVRILRLEHGKANAIDLELMEGLTAALDEAESSPCEALVLTGSGSIFSAGVDLFRVVAGGSAYLDDFLPLLTTCLKRLFVLAKPVVAAINGHAIAGGCILAAACDSRLMAAGEGRIGVPELRVGVPFPAGPLEIVRFVVPNHYLQEVVLGGRTYLPPAARERGLVDEIVAPESLLGRALERATDLAAVGREAFALTKRQLRQPTLELMESTAALADEAIEATWKTEAARQRIRSYLEKTVGRSS